MSDLILGPQLPISNSYFDQTFLAKARLHGEACPADPPTEDAALNSFILLHYYDLPLSLYIADKRTLDTSFLTMARRAADSWWKHPTWINEGRTRLFPDSATPAPRHAGIGGLMLRALDGRPELWGWIVEYVEASMYIWLKSHINDRELYIGLREGAFTLQYAVWLAATLPDAYIAQSTGADGSRIRALMLADVEAICLNYYGRLQHADGSWRWGNAVNEYGDSKFTLAATALKSRTSLALADPVPEAIPEGELIWINGLDLLLRVTAAVSPGSKTIAVQQQIWNEAQQRLEWTALQRDLPAGTVGQYAPMVGIMQPFMVGLLLSALCDAHQIVTTPAVKERIRRMILDGCRYLYTNAYTRLVAARFNVAVGGFHYFYGGGTTINPTKYAKGDLTSENITEAWHISSARQAISVILPSFGYAYRISHDEFFRRAGEEMYNSAYSGSDGFRAMLDDTAKNFNQHARRVGSYIAWINTGEPMPTESPDGFKGPMVTDSTGAVWTLGPGKEVLRNGRDVSGGKGTELKYVAKTVYVHGTNNPPTWWTWKDKWINVGDEPGVVVPTPDPPYVERDWPDGRVERLALLNEMHGRGYRPIPPLVGPVVYFEKVN